MALTKLNLNGTLELDLNLQGTTTATITSPGVIEVDNTLPIATTSVVGVVKPDGTTILIDPDGTIHSVGGGGGGTTHSESLTDGNANFIFAATLTSGGDIITVVGVPN